MNTQLLLKVILLFVAWNTLLTLATVLGIQFFPYTPTFSYPEVLETERLPHLFKSWANFDGIHYTLLSQKGYGAVGSLEAFFPVFPLLIRFIDYVTGSLLTTVESGVVLSFFFSFVLIVLWSVFMKEELGTKAVIPGVLILFLFPTAFFFRAVYTESLFLSVVLSSFLAARKRQWLLAGVLTALASATRVTGIFLVPALGIEVWLQYQSRESSRRRPTIVAFLREQAQALIYISIGSIGLLSYMVFLSKRFGDPLAFFHVQSSFGAGRQTPLIPYPQVVWRAVKILATTQWNFRYVTSIQEFLAGTLPLIALFCAYRTKVRLSYLVFALLCFFLPPLTGTFSSMPRYILVCFPLFLLLTQYMYPRKFYLYTWIFCSGALLLLNTMRFIQGYWVA